MKESRNPFRLRRSESIETDTAFLTLFEPGILDVVQEKGLPETVQPIRSAAGGGKTTLLRLFTPNVLNRMHTRRADEQVRDLWTALESLGAVDEKGPTLLGVMLHCGRNYAMLQDLKIDQLQRTRLFLGLLNARVILATLRSALTFKDLNFPDDLDRLSVSDPKSDCIPPNLSFPCSGGALFDWAKKIERQICAELDSFGPLRETSLPGNDSLFSLSVIRPDSLSIDGEAFANRIVLMMDDIHMLTAQQRSLLIERVIEARSRVGIWIAERFEALSTQEMLASGSSEGRDHEAPIELEWYWRKKYKRFEKHVMRIAERRVRAARETELDTFRSSLETTLEGSEHEQQFEKAIQEVSDRVRDKIVQNPRFEDWFRAVEQTEGTSREKAIGWRTLEILIERELARPQKGLFDDIESLEEEELEKKDDSSVKHAAELFLAREYRLPYYFGPDRIARLASLNIEQFLGLSGSLFEEIIAGELLRGGTQVLSAERQHALMKKAACDMWDDIPNRVRHGRELRAFLESVGKFSNWYTYRPTAPNDPGVSGTAIRMTERAILLDCSSLERHPDHRRFAEILASALAHNYLVADLDYNCKGSRWMVLNLNRLLCVHFDLPLGYGLYKERPLDELCRWMSEPFSPTNGQGALYE